MPSEAYIDFRSHNDEVKGLRVATYEAMCGVTNAKWRTEEPPNISIKTLIK